MSFFLLRFQDILEFIKQAQERVLSHHEEQALLKAYIAEWRKFFTQCSYLPMPFGQLETALQASLQLETGSLALKSFLLQLVTEIQQSPLIVLSFRLFGLYWLWEGAEWPKPVALNG